MLQGRYSVNILMGRYLYFFAPSYFPPLADGKICTSSGQKLNSSPAPIFEERVSGQEIGAESSDKISAFSRLGLSLPKITKVAQKHKYLLMRFGEYLCYKGG